MAGTAVHGRLRWQTATVTTITRETASVVTIELDPPDWPGHQAGQHLEVRLTAEDGCQAEREYSIASAPGKLVAITVERLENGEVSPYLSEDLRPGDELELRGPIARYFICEPGDGGPLMLVAGRSGVVPLRSILRHHLTGWPTSAVPPASSRLPRPQLGPTGGGLIRVGGIRDEPHE
jgi:ferredoxin-NADP reductase